MTDKNRKYLNYIIRIGIVGVAMWFVYINVSDEEKIMSFQRLRQGLGSSTIFITLGVVLSLMFVNWLLEVRKWQVLMQEMEPLGFWKATRSVFCGLTWAIFTPNRIGEYGGRVMLLRKRNRGSGAVLMGVGAFAQLVLVSVFGALSIPWFIYTFLPVPVPIVFGISVLAIIYALAFVLLYFNVHWIDSWVSHIKVMQKIKSFFSVLEDIDQRKLLHVLLLSFSRFLVFTSQYIILLMIVLPDVSLFSAIMLIFILFFVQAALPTIDLFDFSVRSLIASSLYKYITTEQVAVMAVVSLVWFVNLILPAIIGMFFVMNVNYLSESDT